MRPWRPRAYLLAGKGFQLTREQFGAMFSELFGFDAVHDCVAFDVELNDTLFT